MASGANNLFVIQIAQRGGPAVHKTITGLGAAAASIAPRIHAMNNAIGATGSKAQSTGNNVLQFHKRIVGFIASIAGVNLFRQYLDTFTKIQNRLGMVTTGTENLTLVTNALFQSANHTRASFEGTVELYTRLGLATKELNLGQERLIAFTERVNKAVALSGANGHEAYAGLVQFSQGLASGQLQGDELRSILEGLPILADAIAQGMGVTRGDLRKLGAEGKLTAETVIKAIEKANFIEEQFGKFVPTIGQAFTVLNNQVIMGIGQLDKMFGISEKVARSILVIANNMDIVVAALLGVGAALAIAFAPAIVGSILAMGGGLLALLNPAVAIAAAIVGVGVALYYLGDQISISGSNFGSLGDVFTVVSGDIKTTMGSMADFLIIGFQEIWAAMSDNTATNWIGEQLDKLASKYKTFFDGTGEGWAGYLRATARIIDAVLVLLSAMYKSVVEMFSRMPEAITAMLKVAGNGVLDAFEGLNNLVIRGQNFVLEKLGSSKRIDLVDFSNLHNEITDADKAAMSMGLGQIFTGAYDEAFKEIGTFVQDKADEQISKVADVARQRGHDTLRQMERDSWATFNPPGTPRTKTPVDKGAEKAFKRMKTQYESLRSSLDPVWEAQEKVREGNELLAFAFKNKMIPTLDMYLALQAKLKDNYKDALNPMGEFIREMEREAMYLGMSAEAREREEAAYTAVEAYKARVLKATEAETDAIRAQIMALEDLRKMTAITDRLEANSVTQYNKDNRAEIEAFAAKYRANASEDGKGLFGEDDKTAFVAGKLGEAGLDVSPGSMLGEDLRVLREKQAYEMIEELRKNNLLNAEKAAQAEYEIWFGSFQFRMATAEKFFQDMSVLSKSRNKDLANIGRAAAIAEATVNGIVSVTKTLAIYGATPVGYAMAAAAGVAAAANVASVAGVEFASGGYTGDFGRSTPAGTVHGQEYVVNAASTSKYRPQLESMNAGMYEVNSKPAVITPPSTNLAVNINNQIPGAEFEVKQLDERTVEIIAKRVVREDSDGVTALNLRNPNSRTSKSLGQNTKTVRSY